MANPSVTYTFTNSTTADATQVNQNFTDLINGMTDGTKDFSIAALTVAGALTANGNVTLGNASGDDVTVTGSLASTINIKTTNTYDVGSATLGLRSIYFGSSGGAFSTRLIGGAAGASWTMTLPTAVPAAAGYALVGSASGVTSWESKTVLSCTAVKTANYTALSSDDIIFCSGASGAWTLTLPAAASNTGKVYIIKRTDDTLANVVTIDPNASETIEGDTTRGLYTKYETYKIVSDGSNWIVLEHKTETPVASFTPSGYNGIGASNVDMKWWRRGQFIFVQGELTVTTTSGSALGVGLPSGVTVDTGKLPGDQRSNLGTAHRAIGSAGALPGVNFGPFIITHDTADNTQVYISNSTNTGNGIYTLGTGTGLFNASSSERLQLTYCVPVTNWKE